MQNKNIFMAAAIAIALIGGSLYFALGRQSPSMPEGVVDQALAAKFEMLSTSGNSACSAAFKDSIATMPDGSRLKGSCCSAMDFHRYEEQVNGLKKFSGIPEIPSDPYDIDVALAKKLQAYYDVALTAEEQEAYDYAMASSNEKGPCCCKCWRWYVYGGLGKLLIQQYGFTGEQLTEIWNLSDGCGGPGDHATH